MRATWLGFQPPAKLQRHLEKAGKAASEREAVRQGVDGAMPAAPSPSCPDPQTGMQARSPPVMSLSTGRKTQGLKMSSSQALNTAFSSSSKRKKIV